MHIVDRYIHMVLYSLYCIVTENKGVLSRNKESKLGSNSKKLKKLKK